MIAVTGDPLDDVTVPERVAGVMKGGRIVDSGTPADLLDRYPADLFDINLYDYDAEGQVSLRTGARGRLSGAELLAAIQQGRLWVNLRSVETGWPELWAAAMVEFGKVQATYPGMRAVRNAGQLILSSPKARVPYHFDAAGVVLVHLRGRKRLFVYPGDEGHLPERNMEQVVARQTTEELPYTLAFEQDAQVMDLEPGRALTWPVALAGVLIVGAAWLGTRVR